MEERRQRDKIQWLGLDESSTRHCSEQVRIRMQIQTFLTLVTIFKDNYFTPRPLVSVPGVGRLRGTRVKSTLLRRDILGFWGVPYALPPTGNRRFQPPWPAPPLSRKY